MDGKWKLDRKEMGGILGEVYYAPLLVMASLPEHVAQCEH